MVTVQVHPAIENSAALEAERWMRESRAAHTQGETQATSTQIPPSHSMTDHLIVVSFYARKNRSWQKLVTSRAQHQLAPMSFPARSTCAHTQIACGLPTGTSACPFTFRLTAFVVVAEFPWAEADLLWVYRDRQLAGKGWPPMVDRAADLPQNRPSAKRRTKDQRTARRQGWAHAGQVRLAP